jgi:probable HAF family extracellular repeat protein
MYTAFSINDSGIVVGTGIDPNNAARNVGFLYDSVAHTSMDIGALPGRNGALAFDVSNAGQVVGASMQNQGDNVPFIWTQANGMTEIPLPAGASVGSARGVNSNGWVVGTGSGVYSIPFLFDGTTTYRVADLVPSSSGWDLLTNTASSAMSISESGVIVGTGVFNGAFTAYAMIPAAAPSNSQWTANSNGNWSGTGNWSGGVPNAFGATANFASAITAPHTVTIDSPQIVGVINFDNSNKYTIAGASALSLDGPIAASITVTSGSHDITAPLLIGKSATITVSPSTSTLKLSNLLTTVWPINKQGAGTLSVNNVRVGTLNVNEGTVAVIQGRSNTGTSKLKSLAIASGSTLNLNDQDLIVDYPSAAPPPLVDVQGWIATGYAGGSWGGSALTSASAAAAAGSGHRTALGYGDASALGITGTFSGQSIDSTALLIRYTYAGDATLDGKVNTLDFNRLAGNFGTGSLWSDGDFNYDGAVDSLDFTLLSSNYGMNLPISSPTLGSVVPEPASISLLAAGTALLITRRRK